MGSDFSTDPFRSYPAELDRDPALAPMERVKRAQLRLNLADATQGEARHLLWIAVNIALDSDPDLKQADLARQTGKSREAIRLNRQPGAGDAFLDKVPHADRVPDPYTATAAANRALMRARAEVLQAVRELAKASLSGDQVRLVEQEAANLDQALDQLRTRLGALDPGEPSAAEQFERRALEVGRLLRTPGGLLADDAEQVYADMLAALDRARQDTETDDVDQEL